MPKVSKPQRGVKVKGKRLPIPKSLRGPPLNGGVNHGGFTTRAAGGVSLSRGMPRMAEACCAMSNPWDDACRGMKWPDGLSSRSLTMQMRYAFAVQVDGSGSMCLAIIPALDNGVLHATISGTTATYGAAYDAHVLPTIFTANAFTYRFINFGVRMTAISSVATTAGQIVITTLGEAPVLSSTVTIGNYYGIENYSDGAAVGKEYTWVARPTGPRLFVPRTGATSTLDCNWTTLQFSILNGIPNGTTFLFEVCANVEYTLNGTGSTAGLGALSQPDPPANQPLISAAQTLTNKRPSVTEGPPSTLRAQLKSEIKSALSGVAKGVIRKGEKAALSALGGL